jgi:transcription elongation GreA/GreB family factor
VSRAFVRDEQADSRTEEIVPERLVSSLPNYVTDAGLAALSRQVEELRRAREAVNAVEDEDERQQQIARIDRDLRYFQARLETAIPVDPSHLPGDQVHFGSRVTVADEDGTEHTYMIVGEDEADLSQDKISWASPLAKSLMNATVGDAVTWRRPSGNRELRILRVDNLPTARP